MYFYRPQEGHGLPHDPLNAIVAPRPIGWIGTRAPDGRRNLAPYSFFNAFNYTPPVIGFSSTGYKDSARNCADTGEFTWNLVTPDLAEAMNATSTTASVDEFDRAGLDGVPGEVVSAPRVARARVCFECRVTQQVELKDADGQGVGSWLTLGQVMGVHIDDTLLVDGVFDTVAADPLLRAGGPTAYFRIDPSSRVDLRRPID